MPNNATTTPPPGKAKLDHGRDRVDAAGLGPLGILDYDGPETIRIRKYATGTHVLLEELGVETGATPREVVWTKNRACLYRYRGAEDGGGKRRRVPILLLYGFVLKPYILDLVPGNSLVEHLVGEGFDVYLFDFGIPSAEDSGLSLEDLVLDYIPGAIQEVLKASDATEISLFGHSQGGTLSAMYASLFPARPLKNLVLFSAPTEFAPRDPGPFGLWTRATRNSGTFFDPAVVPRFLGNLPTDSASEMIQLAAALQATAVSNAVRPFGGAYDAILRKAQGLATREVSMRSWLAVCKWVDDAAPFPGETFRRWVRTSTSVTSSSRDGLSCAATGWTCPTSRAPCSTSRANGTTSCPPPRPRPRRRWRRAQTRNRSPWTPATSACSSDEQPRPAPGPSSASGSRLAQAKSPDRDFADDLCASAGAVGGLESTTPLAYE